MMDSPGNLSAPLHKDVEMAIAGGGSGSSGSGDPLLQDPTAKSKGLKPIAETTPRERVAGGVAVVAVATALLAMIFAYSPLVVLAGFLSMVIGPFLYYQQTKLTDIRTLQETHEAAQREVDRLTRENVRLQASVEELKGSVTRLEDVEKAMDVIAQTQDQSVNAFAEQVQQNQEILHRMESNLRSNVLQNVLSVILRSDVDRDYKIDVEEIDKIIKRLENVNGVEVNDDRFRAVVRESGGNITAVMKVLKNLLREDVPDSERIFTIFE